MTANISRRSFVKAGALSALSTMVSVKGNAKPAAPNDLKLGMASYTLRAFSRVEALRMSKRLGLDYITFKSFHLPLEAPADEIELAVKQAKESEIQLYAAGVIYMNSADQVTQAFAYARQAGIRMIIGVPAADILNLVEQTAKQFDIQVAIHNHGPEDSLYPTPEIVYQRIKTLDSRIGLCIDIGHCMRTGINPAEAILKYADRLLDIHIKDVTRADKEGETIEMGRGIIDIPAVLKALLTINYQGVAAFEFEKDEQDPLPGVAESVGYVRGILTML